VRADVAAKANGQTLRLALVRAFAMGVEAAGHAAATLTQYFRPRCLAMCGVCAGRPDWTNLGDVIIADRVWRYDVGELVNATPGAVPQFNSDLMTIPSRHGGSSLRSSSQSRRRRAGLPSAR
jgi:nucleoside phosphorylase